MGTRAGRETSHKIILNIVLSCQGKKPSVWQHLTTQHHAGSPLRQTVAARTEVSRQQVSRLKSHTQDMTGMFMDVVQGELASVLLVGECPSQPRKQRRMKGQEEQALHLSPTTVCKKKLVFCLFQRFSLKLLQKKKARTLMNPTATPFPVPPPKEAKIGVFT